MRTAPLARRPWLLLRVLFGCDREINVLRVFDHEGRAGKESVAL